jgi:eukaryotic-like serine/threonine-protein kinase
VYVRTSPRVSRGHARDNVPESVYPQVFGKYVLERELSRGGMARVLLATLRGAGGFEKKLVVKQIRDELAYDNVFVRRFVEEAKTTVALSHPNIVPVYELGVEQGTYFLAMELVEGVSVAELLREKNRDGSRRVLSPEEAAYVGMEVCRALDYAHRRMKVVHRDITPRNVMIDEEGQVKLIDFGIAAPALVSGHEILGSPGHMAPEQVDGGELGPPTDIFAVAVLLMEAWTGDPPFRRATPEACAAAVRERHPRPSDFDPRLLPLDAPIARAMSVDPRARQQEASDLARALRSFLQDVDVADLARGLGDRVRDLRERGAAEPRPVRSRGPRPSVASQSDLGTKTFAAREEALRWSRPPANEIEGVVPSTRRLDGTPDPAPPAPAPPPVDPALSMPTPLMVDVDELERIHANLPEPSTPKQSDVPTVRRAKLVRPTDESIATSPLETPVRPARAGGRWAPLAIGLLTIAAGAAVFWKVRLDGRPSTREVATSETTSRSTSTPIPSISAPASAAPEAPIASSVKTAASVVAVTGKANAALLGEPGTRVAIDGIARGPCPLRTPIDPGPHEVRFTFDPTGESQTERIVVKNGDHITVRAEFTGVTPTIKVNR